MVSSDREGSSSALSRRRAIKLAGAGSVAALAGCSGNGDDGNGNGGGNGNGNGNGNGGGNGNGTAQNDVPDPLKVGSIYPFSQQAAREGQREYEGAQLAAMQAEEEFGITVDIFNADSEMSAETSLTRLRRLVNRDGIQMHTGHAINPPQRQSMSHAQENGYLYMGSAAHADANTGEFCKRNSFRLPNPGTTWANTTSSSVVDLLDKAYVIHQDHEFALNAKNLITDFISQSDKAEQVGITQTTTGQSDFSSELNTIADSEADGIVVIISGRDLIRFFQQYQSRGMHTEFKTAGLMVFHPWIADLEPELVSSLGVFGKIFDPSIEEGRSNEWKQAYWDEFGKTPGGRPYQGYLTMDQALHAVVRNGSLDPEVLVPDLEGHDFSDRAIVEGEHLFREDNHNGALPQYAVRARATEDMENDPWPLWWDVFKKEEARDVWRDPGTTGCEL